MRTWLDPYFSIPAQSPFPIGRSPFRQRGQVYVRNLVFWNAAIPGGVAALCAQMRDPAMARFLQQRFAPSELYDALPSALATAAIARLRKISTYQCLRELGAFQADDAFGGFSGVLLRLLSNETVATWLPRLSASFHDFGSIETKVAGPGVVRGVRYGMPRMFLQVWGTTATEITERILSRAGAVSPRCLVLEPEPDGDVEGYEVFRVPFEVRWNQ
jgi:hypothetical protein